MNTLFSDRILTTQKSFIREILKVTENPEVISFAGGLPNSRFFPVKEIKDAANKVLEEDGKNVLQYSTTEGYLPLREFISKRYLEKKGLKISPDEILITNGSQQCLDLIGKTFLNKGDHVAIERPGYLGTIQAFSMFEPEFHSVPLLDDGIDTASLERTPFYWAHSLRQSRQVSGWAGYAPGRRYWRRRSWQNRRQTCIRITFRRGSFTGILLITTWMNIS